MDSGKPNIHMTHLRSLLKKLETYHSLAKRKYERTRLIDRFDRHPEPCEPLKLDWTIEQVIKYLEALDRQHIPMDKAVIRRRKSEKRWEMTWNVDQHSRLQVIEDVIASIFTAKRRLVPHLIERIADETKKFDKAITRKRFTATQRAYAEVYSHKMAIRPKWANYNNVIHHVKKNPQMKEALINYCDKRKINLKRQLHKTERLMRTVQYKMWKGRHHM